MNILESIKILLGVESHINAFDAELLMHINSAIAELIQGGVGPQDTNFSVGADTAWSEFSNSTNVVSYSKEYIYCKVRLLWDPPTNSFVCDGFRKSADEAYWRAYLESDELRRKEAENNGRD